MLPARNATPTEEDNVWLRLEELLSTTLEIAVQLELQTFSVLNLMGKNPLTIVLKLQKFQIHSSKIGLAHKEKTNVLCKKMF